jgi:hypothetical protein
MFLFTDVWPVAFGPVLRQNIMAGVAHLMERERERERETWDTNVLFSGFPQSPNLLQVDSNSLRVYHLPIAFTL